MKKIAMICASELPLPAARGGATETLMTNVIEENEIHKELEIVAYSYFDESAFLSAQKYERTVFRYYRPTAGKKLLDIFFRLLRRIALRKIAFVSGFLVEICGEIQNGDFDFVLICGNQMYVDYVKKTVKKPVVLHMHTDLLNVDTPNAERIVDACAGIVVVSDYCGKRVGEICPAASGKIKILRNTIDFGLFNRNREMNLDTIRSKMGLDNDCPTILFCGRLDKGKGALQLLLALKTIDEKVRYNLLVVGGALYSSNRETKYGKALKRLAGELRNKVVFTGHVSNGRLPELYAVSDLTVFPSLCNEAAGLITIESLAMATPVFTSDRGGIPEYASSKACKIIPADERFVERLADEIFRFLTEPRYRNELAAEANRYSPTYTRHEYYQEFVDIFGSFV